jgi:riboflavin kinase/FMN adenylyltransferase
MTAPASADHATIWHGLAEIPVDWPACAVTIGVFDGVHRGHARLIERTRRIAETHHLPTVLVTFDPHPARVLGLPKDTAALSTVDTRADLAHRLGVDAVCVLPFTSELAAVPAPEFVRRVLVDALHAKAVVVGENFTFGHRGAGTLDTLRELGRVHGFQAHGVGLVPAGDTPCSSSHVRECLRRGDIRAAVSALGRPHRVDGLLAGDSEVLLAAGTALPAAGRYAGLLDDHPAALEVTKDGRLFVRSSCPAAGSVTVTVHFVDRAPAT